MLGTSTLNGSQALSLLVIMSQMGQTKLPSPCEVTEREREEGMVYCCGAKEQLITREGGMVRLKARIDLF